MRAAMEEENAFKELMAEHDQLRKAILQNDFLEIQTLAATIVLAGAAMTVASSEAISISWVRGVLFYASGVIAMIGLWQTVDLSRSTFLIASYLRTFIEPKTHHLRWETRLHKFRAHPSRHGHIHLPTYRLGHGQFEGYRMHTYLILIAAGLSVGTRYIYPEFQGKIGLSAIAVIGVIWIGALFLAAKAIKLHAKVTLHNKEIFDDRWQEIKSSEQPTT